MTAKIIEFPGDNGSPSAQEPILYQIKATILESEPPIWRRILVPSGVDMGLLHESIAKSFDWAGYHLYLFEKDGVSYDAPQLYDDMATKPAGSGAHYNAEKKGVAEVLRPGDKLLYTYDLGDSWEIELEVEDEVPEADILVPFFPICVDGARLAPPEDCGGVGGYEDLCRILADPSDPAHGEMLDWAGYESGADFDPEFFDVFGLNESFAFDMVDEMEADLIPDDPEELKEMCKSLLVEKMLMMMSISMSMNLKEDGAVL